MSQPPIPAPQNTATLRWLAVMVALVCISMIAVAGTRFKAENPQQALDEGPHMPCQQEGECLSFIAFGDSGSGNSNQMAVAAQMASTYADRPFSYALLLGDNIYDHGDVKQYGEARFNKPYKPLLDAGVRFVVALGNHDVYKGFGNDQVAFFNMPGRYYSVADDSGRVEFFVIDSNTFYTEEIQRQWLESALAKSTAQWKIVAGHHPPFTSGAHAGEGDLTKLRNTLVPILIQHNVDMYLAGHDHNYERFKNLAGVQYFVTGGAGAWLRDFKHPAAGSLVRIKRYHFMRFDIDAKHLHFQAIDKDGSVFDQGQINKTEQAPPSRQAA